MKVLSIAPARISLFGGGTDLDPYASEYGGIVINMAINLRHKTVLYTQDHLFEWRGNGVGGSNFPPGADPFFYFKLLEKHSLGDGVHLSKVDCHFDGLIEAGLGSSASAVVSLLGAINKFKDLGLTTGEIAKQAWEYETQTLGLYGGKQDQYAAAFGGVNIMEIGKEVKVTPLARGYIEPLLPSLVLLYTGIHRQSSKIQQGFKNLSADQIATLNKIKMLALNAIDPVMEGNYKEVGKLLNESWELKKASNPKVITEKTDELYQKGIKLGAYGGKLLGAGGGGFMLFIVEPDKQKDFIEHMGLDWFDFGIDYNGLEVRVLE